MLFMSQRAKHDFLDTCAHIKFGRLRLRTPEGEFFDFGHGQPSAEMTIRDWSVVTAAAARGDIGLGETYVAGLWDTPSIADLATIGLLNLDHFRGYAYASFWNSLKFRVAHQILRINAQRGKARSIRAHQNVGNEFYQQWLDDGMTYSSAMFADDDRDLHRGQNRKYDRILDRMGSSESILEIGCGWGGFAERAANIGRRVTGLTISPKQKGFADARLDGRADILLQDYRHSSGTYENIVSIEMVEAVGPQFWPTYFATLKARMAENGRAVIQSVTVPNTYFDIYRRSADYIRNYAFPGGMLMSPAIIARQAKTAGLAIKDSHAFGADYARTCSIWHHRLNERSPQIRNLGYDEEFLRSWRFYLGICTASFAVKQTDVLQLELTHV